MVLESSLGLKMDKKLHSYCLLFTDTAIDKQHVRCQINRVFVNRTSRKA